MTWTNRLAFDAAIASYESRLDADPEWAMSEGSKFFHGEGEVQQALKRIAKRLGDLGIDYVIVGGMALFRHGYRRFTDDVDILTTRVGLRSLHEKLSGLGYLPPFEGSKHLRDVESGVKIEFLVTGDYPGDGKPKPIAFPDPTTVAEELDGIRYIRLEALIELKLASGMTSADRMRDLADVVELIKACSLPLTYADSLNPFVQEKYRELWQNANPPARRFVRLWRNKQLTREAKSLDEMIDALQAAADCLRVMLADGVVLDQEGGTSDDYVYLVSTDPKIAKKYDMHDEREFLSESDDESE